MTEEYSDINSLVGQNQENNQSSNKNNFGKEVLLFVWETVKIIVISLAIILPIRYYLVQPFFVKGASMEPNFEDGDYLLIDEISYRFNRPQRGDVIIFKFPGESTFFIKRMIGLPGERIVIKNRKVEIYNGNSSEGLTLNEGYLGEDQFTSGDIDITLSENEYYVLGDNRLQSLDSRRWGAVPGKAIVGKVMIRAWPLDKFKAFSEIEYQN